MKVWIEEEYGYADYIWESPFETKDELNEWWESFDKKQIPKIVFDTGSNLTVGENTSIEEVIENREEMYQNVLGGKISLKCHSQFCMEEDEWDQAYNELKSCNFFMHFHEEEDSYLHSAEIDPQWVEDSKQERLENENI